ncbi:universal stress protein [Caballeronia terrestris]|uniref:Universal stress protein n=2 Tax=Caballeronia TaxID=1827195 RepID=A0A158KZ94_9BURK|nr:MULTISPECIES: universal stress protein [Caballeronia]SAL61743.1 universal stress protein [Caballeronia humi]SAL85910.1 universal stress protein [Caballeronia terrestris]
MNSATEYQVSTDFSRILLCIDSTTPSARLAGFARQLATEKTQVRIVGVLENARAVFPLGPLAGFNLSAAHAQLLKAVKDGCVAAHECLTASGASVDSEIIDLVKDGGDAAHALAHEAQKWQADLMVLGSRHHRGLLRWVERAASAPVLKIASCAILVVPEQCERDWSGRPQRILFAVDGSPASLEALRSGSKLAAAGALFRAIYVVDRAARVTDFVPLAVLQDAFVEEGKVALANAREAFAPPRDAEGVMLDGALTETDLTSDDVPHAILREATRWQADLLVMGTHGRRGVARWMLGSVSGRVAELTQMPLLLVRKNDSR